MALNTVPNPLQTLLPTRDQIRQNFETLNTRLNGVTNLACVFPQIADPVIGVTEVAVYQKNNALYWKRGADGSVKNMTDASPANNGWTRLPSGITILWLNNTINPVAGAFTLNAGFASNPNLNFVYSITVNARSVSALVNKPMVYATNFDTALNQLTGNAYNPDGSNYSGAAFSINAIIIGRE